MRMIEKVKKGLSVLLCLVMLVQYMPVTARAAETSDTVTVYFQNNWLWSEVSLYYWGSGGTNPEWPGYSMALVENDGTYDVYKFEVPTDVTGFVINGIKDDGSGNRDQTPDITGGWYDGICYYMQWADGNQVGSYASYCEHSSHDTEGICGSCTANVGHSYDSTGFCSCGLECSHSSETNGVCDTCGKTVSHTHNYVNGACSCGAAAQVLVTYNDSTTKYFETLQDALDTLSANNSDVTVKLLTNISVGDKVSADIYTHYTLDLNGYCLTANELVVPASGGMEIMDGSGGRTGQVNALVRAHGPLIIWGGTFNNTVLITTMSNVKGSVIVREGTFTAAADFQIADDACSLSLWDCAFPGGIKVEAVADASASKADLAAFPYYGRSYFLNCEEAVLTQGQSEISGDMVRVAYQVSHQFGTSNKCAACGLDAIVSMTLDGVTTYYGTVYDLRQDLVQENAGCTIQLLTDITTTYFADKDGRCGFYLDLNGHTLTASDGVSLPGSSGCTIMDTSAEKNGKIVGEVYAAYSTALTGGTIEGTVSFPKKASSTGYTFQMEGGTIDADMDFGINDNNTIIKLTGGSFPGGISIACGDNVITPKTLADCISGNYRYFQNGSVVTLTEGQTQITGGDVTVAVHAGHTHSYVNGFCELVEGETHYEPAILNDNGWYEIGNAGQLYWFAQQVDNGTGATYNVVLTADITDNPGTVTAESTGLRQWNPIGNDWNSCYNGIFDGNHKTISGLYFESTAKENNGAGLFTCIGYNATVKNVSLTNSHLHSYRYAGGIVGWNRGIIIDCVNHATISASAGHVGGVTGSNEGIIERCGNTGSVTSTNSEQNDDNAQYAGGVVGSQGQMKPGATLRNCWNTGSVNGTVCVGGVVGALTSAVVTIENCWSTGNVTGTESTTVGGVAGQVTNGKIINCYAPQATAVGEQATTATVTNVESKTLEQFASGEVTYLFQTRSANNLWGQDLDNGKTAQLHPAFDGALVYQIAANCAGAPGYSNTNENKGTHNYSENGFCINPDVNGNPCDDYQPAEKLTAERCAELGLDAACDGWYAIGNAGNLYWFAQQVDNNVGNNYNVVLTDNITVNSGTITANSTGVRVWNPIGYYNSANDYVSFNGTFDGNGKTISGLYFSDESINKVALIAVADTAATVKNVTLSNSYFYGYWDTGGIVSTNYGTITSCFNNATIKSVAGAAGVAGANLGTIELCGNTGSIDGGTHSAGGIVGYNHGIIRNCWNTGNISVSVYWAGGIAGYQERVRDNTPEVVIENCWSTGKIDGGNSNIGGGVAGRVLNNAAVQNCYTTDAITVPGIFGTDIVHNVESKTLEQFAAGEVAYLLQTRAAEGTNVWGQDLDNGKTAQLHPTFDGALVYQIAANCAGAPGYSNTNENKGAHNYSENGFCINPDVNGNPCDDYQPAEKLTAERCAELGLDAAYDGYYAIGNAGQLYWFSQMVDTEYTTYNNANVVLIDDITVNEGAVTKDSTGIRVWNPIGSSSGKEDFSHAYNGTFDGNGHSISGLYYHEANTYGVGLIAAAGESAVVKDVTLSNSWFFGYINVGGIVALNKGAISGCVNAADMDIYWQNLGGIVGTNYGAITGCSNSGTIGGWITNTGIQNAVAGIAGGSYGTVEQCENEGNITSRHNSAGGIVGVAALGAEVSKCRNTGNIKSTIWAGGIVAHNSGTVTLCVSEAAVTSGNHVGGIVGLNLNGSRAYVKNCWSTGTVTGTDNGACVGGIVGTNSTANGCLNCWSTAAVTGTGTGAKAGGIVGYATTENSTKNGYTTHEKPVGESFLYADVDWDTLLTKTEEQFASGEVAYLLQKDQTEQVWGQNLDNGKTVQAVPTFDGAVVYQIITDCAGKVGYSNTNSPAPDHVYVNGFCDQVAGQTHYEPAEKLTAERCAELGLDAAYAGYYAIGNGGQLYWFSQLVDEGDVNANAVLLNDIVVNQKVVNADGTLVSDASSLRVWKPIGKRLAHYRGVFDGNGKTVSGLYFNNSADASVDAPNENIGLIGVLAYGAVVKNVTVSDSYLYGNYSVGSVAGYNFGTVSGCRNNSTVGASNYVGGVVGYNNNGIVELCANTGKIKAYDSNAGGIVGYCTGIVRNSWNTGEIDAVEACAGGIAGSLIGGNARVENCWTNDAVIYENGGGIAGLTDGTVTIRNCYTMHATAVGEARATAVITDVLTKTVEQFASGEVAYLLRTRVAEGVENVWGQNIDNGGTNEGVPVFSDAKVYQVDVNCVGDKGYSNTDASKVVHNYDDNGFCINPAANGDLCDAYEPAVEVKADNWESLGLTESYIGYYAISNAGQLYWFADKVDNENDVYRSANVVLTDNITVNEGTVTAESSGLRHWNPIGGDYDTGFNGTFDGNHKTISGLYFNDEKAGCVGLISFGWYESTVCNVTLSNSYLYGNVAVGGIIGYNRGRVTGCVNHATIHAADMSAGGIVGLSEGPIELCGNTGSISNSSNGNGSIGGIVGEYAYSVYAPEDDHLVNCWNTGDVTGTKLAGGIAGQFASGDIWPAVPMENCWSTGNVTGMESATTGGVVGLVSNARIVNCYAPQTNPVGELATSATAINVESKTIQQFASGEVAYLLQTRAAEGTNVWGQNLDNGKTVQTVPTFDGAAVYQIVANCAGDTGYSNTNENKGTHNYSENGFCINPDVNGDPCDDYQPAERLTAARCTELGLDAAYAGYYAIKNAGNLYWFADKVDNENYAYETANVVLTKDITINSGTVTAESTGLRQWNPIGWYGDSYDYCDFNGIFDGNYKTISGLYFNTDAVSHVGLIAGTGEDALVKNVTLSNSYILAPCSSVGGIVGSNNGTISGCINNASVNAKNPNESVFVTDVGGIAGCNMGSIIGCINNGDIFSEGMETGGIAGWDAYKNCLVENCANTGTVTGVWAGGIMGRFDTGTIRNCWSIGEITGRDTSASGGIVGFAPGAEWAGTGVIQNCYATQIPGGNVWEQIVVTDAETKTLEQFASGEVAYLLRTRAAEGTNVWGQDLDNGKTVQTVPTFDGAAVYRGYASCTDTAAKYTNDSTISPDPIPHDWKYTANGAQITGQCGYNCGTDSGKVTLTAPANTVYEGVEKTVTVAGALTDVTTLPQVTYEGDRVNVGTFTAKLTVGDATAQLPVQIVPYELEIQTFVPETKVYDGTTTCGVKSLSFVSTANGEELVLGTDFSAVLTFPGTDAGEYTDVVLTVQLLDTPLASNYKLKNGTITGATHTITPAAITVTDVKVEDKVYDGTTDATVTGVTISGVLAGETVSVKAEGVFADKNSGENKTVNLTYTLSGEDAGNYVLAEETGTTTAKITVKPLPEIMEPVKDLTVDNVTSEDKDALEDVKEELEHVLTDEGLSDEERKEREDALKDVQDMLDRIQEAADAIKTDPIIDTKHITAENVVPEDREDIENALEDLYGALENYENNYTETEKDGIQDDIERLEAALAALKAVEDVIKEIEELPDGVEPDTELRDDILDTKGKYDELPERLKDMIPQELVDKLNKLLADLKVYLIIKGDGQTWSEGALGFTANGPCDRFVQLLIDGNVVDASNYTVVSGSTVLTIKESYAKTLTGGKHSISFVYPDGQAVGSFTVVIPTNGSATTGDDANIVFWTGAMVVSLAALAVLLAESRKRRYAK